MKRSVLLAVAVFTAVVASSSAAELGTLVVGGGEGRLDSDVDGDGDLDGSYFGIGVVQQDGESSGYFVYGMWGNTDVMELPLLAIEGQISSSEVIGGSEMLFSGSGTVDLGDGVAIRDLPFDVLVIPSGPDEGSMQLTIKGAFDSQLGDLVPGNSDCEMPPQSVASGQISMRPLTEENVVIPDGAPMIGGGGLTTFGKDLDEDGDVDGAYFGLGIDLLEDGGASGHFVCAMWGDVEYWGLRLMAIEGSVDSVAFEEDDPDNFAFFGRGTVDLGMGPDGFFTDIAYDVQARSGGPTDGWIRLTIHGVLDGVPGDRIHENGDCDLPIEWVDSGVIAIQRQAASIPTAVETIDDTSPDDFVVVQNYPNPFNSSTILRFSLAETAPTELAVYNTTGQKVAQLIDGPRGAGSYTLQWDGRDHDGRDLATGTYLVRLRAGRQIRESKLLLVR